MINLPGTGSIILYGSFLSNVVDSVDGMLQNILSKSVSMVFW